MYGKIDPGKAAKMSGKLVSLLGFSSIVEKKEMLAFENKQQRAESKILCKFVILLVNISPSIDIPSSFWM